MAVDSIGFINPETNQLRSKKELDALEKKAAESKSAQPSTDDTASTDNSTASALSAVRTRTSQQVNAVVGRLDQRKETLDGAKQNLKDLRSTAKDLKEAIKSGDEAKAGELRQQFAVLQDQREKLAKKADSDNQQARVDGPAQVRVGNRVKASFKFDDVEVKKGESVDTQTTEGLNKFLDDSQNDLDKLKSQIQADKDVRKQVKQVNSDARTEINSIADSASQQNKKQIASLEEAGLVAKDVADQVKQNPEESLVSQIEASQAETLLAF